MSNRIKNAAKGLLGILSAFLLVTVMSACGSKTTLAGDWADDGTYTITADTAKDDDMYMINYEIEEGTKTITFASNLSSGTVHVALNQAVVEGSTEELDEDATVEELTENAEISIETGEAYITFEANGDDSMTVDAIPGSYMLVVTGDSSAPATGTVTITPEK